MSLEDEECSGQPPEVDSDQLRAIIETDPLRITREVVEELSADPSMVVWLLKQIGKMKRLNKVGTSWTDWKSKISSLSSVVFSNCTQQQQTVSQSDCDVWWKVDCVWELAMPSSLAGLRRSCRALPRARLAPEKVVCHWPHAVQLSDSQWSHYILEVCSANRWDALQTAAPASGVGEQKGTSSSP